MKCGQQLLSFFLAVCLVLAGAAGLSPSLHRWLDHGGQGAAHTHSAHSLHSHGTGAIHFPANLLSAHVPIKLTRSALAQAPRSPKEKPEPHSHQSLSQLLLAGAVESSLALFAPLPAPAEFGFVSHPSDSHFIAPDWDAQSASRGPPA